MLSSFPYKIYKVIEASTLLDVGLYEEKILQNDKIKKIKSKACLKQHVIITFSRKSMEYQRFIRNLQIEDCFRILKTDFSSRPYFHRNRGRIIAHFMICYTALLIYRLLEVKLSSFSKEIHLTTRNIVETMQNMQVSNISDMSYVSQYTGSKALTALEGVFALGLDRKNFLPKDLNKNVVKNFKISFGYNIFTALKKA